MREATPRQVLIISLAMIWLALVLGSILVGATGLTIFMSLAAGGAFFLELVRLITKPSPGSGAASLPPSKPAASRASR